MGHNQRDPPPNCSRGVHTSDIPQPTSSTATDSEVDHAYEQFHHGHTGDDERSFNLGPRYEEKKFIPTSDTSFQLHHVSSKWRRGQQGTPSSINIQEVNRGLQKHALRKKQNRRYLQNYRPRQVNPVPAVNVQMQQNHAPDQAERSPNVNEFQSQGKRLNLRKMISTWFRNRGAPTIKKLSAHNINLEAGETGENAEVYYFDHGSPLYFRTTDCPPHLISEIIAQRIQSRATKFWAEFFGFINVFVTFFITFFIQFYRFILYSIFRAIIVGFLQTTSDYLLKPIIALLFNGFLQLIFTFVQNIFQSIADLFFPLTILLGNILKPFTECLRAFRVVEIKNLRKDFVDRQNGKQQETDQKWKGIV